MNNAKAGYVILDGCKITTEEFASQIGARYKYGYLDLQGYAHPLPDCLVLVEKIVAEIAVRGAV